MGRTCLLPMLLLLAGCSARAPASVPAAQPGHDLVVFETAALKGARAVYGETRVAEALAADSFLIATRHYGRLPPPPPGAVSAEAPGPVATVLRVAQGRWWVAGDGGWRAADPEAIAAMLSIARSRAFGDEAAHIPPYPDYGASHVVARIDGQRFVRSAACPSATDRLVLAAETA